MRKRWKKNGREEEGKMELCEVVYEVEEKLEEIQVLEKGQKEVEENVKGSRYKKR